MSNLTEQLRLAVEQIIKRTTATRDESKKGTSRSRSMGKKESGTNMLGEILNLPNPHSARKSPIWEGPAGKGPNGGVSYSMLCRWLTCRERFRLYVAEGLKAQEHFNIRLEFGNLWHIAEEAYAKSPETSSWAAAIQSYTKQLLAKYPFSKDQVLHWSEVCRITFPIYLNYWSKRYAAENRVSVFREKSFSVMYALPSGRQVRLRGKWDNVDIVGEGSSRVAELTDHKTKGEIDEEKLTTQLLFDLQTMTYAVAFEEYRKQMDPKWSRYVGPLTRIRYNVIRRPLSGGAGSIRQHKPTKKKPQGESREEFYSRLGKIIETAPETYFMRWGVEITEDDIKRFRVECLDPILANLCAWWDHVAIAHDPFMGSNGLHWRHPYGIHHVLDQGGSTDLDNYLACGTMAGLQQVDNLFPEL